MDKKSSKTPKNAGGPADISNYKPPDNVVKIQSGDTGFALVKKHYNRFIWTWNEYTNKKKNK